MNPLPLTVVSQTALAVVVKWTPPAGVSGYRFLRDGVPVSSSWDPAKSQIKFGIPDGKPHTVTVTALSGLAQGQVTVNQPDPPPPPSGMVVGTNAYPGQNAKAQEFSKHVRVDRGQPSDWRGATVCGIVGLDATSWMASCPIVELDNEPYFAGVDVSAWAVRARDCAKAVRAKNPSAKILLPAKVVDNGDYNQGGGWKPWLTLVNAAAPDIWQYLDGVAVHPYTQGQPPAGFGTMKALDNLRGQLKSLGQDRLKFWATEFGYTTGPSQDGAPAVTEAQQATFLGQQLAAFKARGDVAAAHIFVLYDQPGVWAYGLLRSDGSRKPAWDTAHGAV